MVITNSKMVHILYALGICVSVPTQWTAGALDQTVNALDLTAARQRSGDARAHSADVKQANDVVLLVMVQNARTSRAAVLALTATHKQSH